MRYTAFYSETAVYRLTGPIIKSKLYFCVFLPRVCHLNFNITCTHSLIPFYFRCDKLWKLKNFYSLFIASNNFCGIQLLLIRNVDVWKGFMRERHDRTMVNNQLLRNWELKKKIRDDISKMSNVVDFFTGSYFADRRNLLWTGSMPRRKQEPIFKIQTAFL